MQEGNNEIIDSNHFMLKDTFNRICHYSFQIGLHESMSCYFQFCDLALTSFGKINGEFSSLLLAASRRLIRQLLE